MPAVMPMPRKKKSERPAEVAGAEKTEFSEAVKLREAFKLDLQMVAVRMKVPMGDLIERQMWQFVQTMLALAAKGQSLPVPPAPPGAGSPPPGRYSRSSIRGLSF